MAEKPPIDPKDVAASTAVGSAQRYGTGVFRRRRQEAEATGAGVGSAPRRPRRSGGLSYVVTVLVVAALLVAMLVAMVKLS